MRKDRWEEWVRNQMAEDRIEQASDSFYHNTWIRIRTATPASPARSAIGPLASIGTACWRSIPAFAALLLIIALYCWFYPPDSLGRILTTPDSEMLNINADQSNTELFYQIMNTSQASEAENQP
jgi:hypothetical protein